MLHSVMSRAKRLQILDGVISAIGKRNNVMLVEPSPGLATISVLVGVGASILIAQSDVMLDARRAVTSSVFWVRLQLRMS